MVKRKRSGKESNVKLAIGLIILILFVLSLVFINDNVLTGNAILDYEDNRIGKGRALTLDQLARGVTFTSHRQIFVWTDELEDPVAVEQALASLTDLELVLGVEGVDINKGWAGSGYGYAQEKKNDYYYQHGRVLKELRPGRKYELKFASVPQTLRYRA